MQITSEQFFTRKNGKFTIAIPTMKDILEVEYYKLPSDIFNHKDYPTCLQCERKYVPINKGEMICFQCSFTRK